MQRVIEQWRATGKPLSRTRLRSLTTGGIPFMIPTMRVLDWTTTRVISKLHSCADHPEVTRLHHPRNHVVLDGTKCLYCHAR
jgi:hypothetical protein